MPVKTYDPKKIIVTLSLVSNPAFTHVVTGYAKDTFVKIGRISDAILSEAGASGEVARAINADRRGMMELTLMQTSISNDFLSIQAALDEATGAGLMHLLVTDLRGTTLYAAKNCWIKKTAESEYSQSLSNRVWPFETDELEVFVGGVLPVN